MTPMQPMQPMQRRRFLKSLGLAGGATVFESLRPRTARAAVAPRRLLVFYTYQGTLPTYWQPTGSESDFTLNELSQPYAQYKNDLIFLDGLDMLSKDLDRQPNPGNAHAQGQNHALAAIDHLSPGLAGGPTIDQTIAKGLNARTQFPSLELGISNYKTFPSYHYLIQTGAGQRIPSEGDPAKVWARMFGDFTPPGGAAPSGPDPAKLREKSVLDYVRGEIGAVGSRLSASDRRKLDAHTQAVRDLEVRLALDGSTVATPTMGCSKVDQAAAVAASNLRKSSTSFNAIADQQVKMAAMALACDMTRVLSLNVNDGQSWPYVAGSFGSSDGHDLVHKTSPDNGALRSNPDAVAMMKGFHVEYHKVFGKLLKALAEMPDVDGKRVLDNTIVLWAGEFSVGSHVTRDLHWMLAGSGGGQLKTGRYLKFDRLGGKGPSHSNLFVSLANAMGVPITTFGNPAACTGKLARL